MAVLAGGHMLADTCQGAIPALLPFLIAQRGYSYAAASALVLAATVSSSVVQPLFGHLTDRRSLSWLMPAGVLVGGTGVALVGIAHSYALIFGVIVFSGLGVAAFHPEGSRFANYVSGPKRASGMSLFSLGGNAGFAMGPVLVTPLVLAFGLSGTLLLIVPAALVAGWLAHELPRLGGFRPERRAGGEQVSRAQDRWGAFARLGGVTAARTIVYFGLITFVPLYYVGELGASKAEANAALAVMLVGGAVGTLVGGRLADRIGRRTTLILSLSLVAPLVLAFHAAGKDVATALVFLIGAATVATFSVTVVMGQEYLPSRIGVASGVTLGLAIGVGGLGAPLLGLVADRWGLSASLDVIAVLPVLGVLMALTLPPERSREAEDAGRLATAEAG